MLYFAQVDETNVVVNVIVLDGKTEKQGLDWLKKALGGNWLVTYSLDDDGTPSRDPIRGLPAGVGSNYDPVQDKFYEQQPYPSWVLDPETLKWSAPVQLPEDAFGDNPKIYRWDESTQSWVE